MIYRVLLIFASLIFIVNYVVGPRFLDMEVSTSGTFVGLMLIIVVLSHLLDGKKK